MSALKPFVRLREADWSTDVVEERLSSFHALRIRRARRNRALLAMGSATAVVVLVFLFVSREGPSDTVAPSRVADKVEPPEKSPLGDHQGEGLVDFLDGSTARLQTEGSRLAVREVSPSAIVVELSRGAAEFEVEPSHERRFVVEAGDLVVTVLGTRFAVRIESGRTHVAVARGKVRVDQGTRSAYLIAGEAGWFERQNEGVVPSSKADPNSTSSEKLTSTEAKPGHDAHQDFVQHHSRGDYRSAYDVLKGHEGLVTGSARDLMRAADAARYSGHPAEATRFLEKVPSTDPLASSARFTLGRLYLHELGDPAEAATAFAEARRLAPGGALAEDAFFREIEARSKAGQAAKARTLAERYLANYPASRRGDAVKRFGGLK